MRRAIYHGREHLGFNEAFFYKVCDLVVSEMGGPFPELETQRDFIGKMVRIEEERFGNTVTVGLARLNDLGFSSETARDDELFLAIGKLYDTYGTPRDLIRVYLEEKGVEFGEDEFNERFDRALQELQQQGSVGKTERKSQISPVYAELLEKVGSNEFHGYDTTRLEDAKVVALLNGEEQLDELAEGQQGSVVLDHTPFYAEAGGQVGDVGILVRTAYGSGRLNAAEDENKPLASAGGSDMRAIVADTYSPVTGLIIHKVTVEKGTLKVGDTVTAIVDAEKRDATRRNHTATHLVHAALREVLGTHVKQAGSVVAPNVLRFDFTHYQPMTDAEIAEVEVLVNRYILKNEPVNTNIMAIEEAMQGGAMALFGEKYGSAVRVLSVGDGVFSKELCGGTHVRATGDIGSFKITADEAIASGVRRIRAITGFDAFDRFREDERLIDASLGALNTQRDNLPNAIARLQDELKKTRKEMDELKLKIATGAIGSGSGPANGDEARDVSGVQVLGKVVEGLDANGTRQLSDTLLARLKSGVVVLGRKDDGKVGIIVRVSDDLTSRVKAGDIIREIAPIVGGRGGGKPDMAEGGGTEPGKLSEAIDASYGVIERMLS
jgi:alanyl-tRNA synthetase